MLILKSYRDFTYIDDVIEILLRLINKHKKIKANDIFNICSKSSKTFIYFNFYEKLFLLR